MNGLTDIQPYLTMDQAMDAVRQHLSRFSPNAFRRPCLVFDLDDSALTSVPIPHNPSQQMSVVIPSVKAVHDWSEKNGIPTVAITARPYSKDNYSLTLDEVKSLGYRFRSLHLMPELKYGAEPTIYDIANFKATARARLRSPPHNLWPVVNVGNMPQDLTILTPPTLYTETVRQMDMTGIYGFMALNEDPMMLNIKLPDFAK